jgi:hypothetical protein
MTLADEVDVHDPRSAVGNARAREQRVDRAAALVERGIDAGLVAQVDLDPFDALDRDVGVVHHDDFGAEVSRDLRRRGAHAGRAADDERALAVVPEHLRYAHGNRLLGSDHLEPLGTASWTGGHGVSTDAVQRLGALAGF